MINEIDALYHQDTPRWSNISSLAEQMGWTELVAQTMAEYLDVQGINKRFSREVVEAATRVNYAQVSQQTLMRGFCDGLTEFLPEHRLYPRPRRCLFDGGVGCFRRQGR